MPLASRLLKEAKTPDHVSVQSLLPKVLWLARELFHSTLFSTIRIRKLPKDCFKKKEVAFLSYSWKKRLVSYLYNVLNSIWKVNRLRSHWRLTFSHLLILCVTVPHVRSGELKYQRQRAHYFFNNHLLSKDYMGTTSRDFLTSHPAPLYKIAVLKI